MGFEVDTSEITKGLSRFETRLERQLQTAVENLLELGEQVAKQKAPIRTGFLRSQIEKSVVRVANHLLSGEVVSKADYSLYVEGGTAHKQAQPFMLPALRAMEKQLPREVAAAIQRALR